MRQINSRPNGATIKQYSTTILLIGSILSTACYADGAIYHARSNYDAVKQSMIAEFALAYHDAPTAVHNYTVLSAKSRSTAVKQRALNIALEQEDIAAALDIATHWVEQEPKDVPALFYLSHIALKAHEYELAAQTIDKILNIDSNADLEEILQGISPESPEDRDYLIDALRSSTKNNNPSILVLIAGLEAQTGQLENALNTINQALKKRPKTTSYILMKANLLNALGDEQATIEWYEKSSKRHKNNFDIQIAEAKFLIRENKTELALNKLERILKKWPHQEDALFMAGLTSIDLQHYEKAEKYLVELRTSNQYQNEAYYYLAVNAERKEHYETAKAYYRLVDGSLYTVSRRNMIAIYAKQDQLHDALRFLTQERVNYPQHASFLYQAQAEILVLMNNKNAAIRLLDEAIKALPDDPELIYAEVLLLDPFADRIKLDKLLNNLLEIEPNNPSYLNAYAYTLALQNRSLQEARQIAEYATELAPEQASILDTLGFITYLQNDFAASAQALSKAYALSNSVKIGVRYAKSLYMQGNLEEFERVLHELQTKHKNDPQLEALNSLLLPQSSKRVNNTMRVLHSFSIGLITSSLFLTGCQQFTQPLGSAPTSTIEAPNQFNLQGKIGVRTPQQSGSAFFRWVQDQQEFDIELSGILGVGKTQISGKAGEVTLNSANTGLIQAENPEELLKQATGWDAPITHLVQWVQARPATSDAQITKDEIQRIHQIYEDGWNVELSYNEQALLPNKLILKQSLESGQENRITMIIQNR